jgi:hypothetical protein
VLGLGSFGGDEGGELGADGVSPGGVDVRVAGRVVGLEFLGDVGLLQPLRDREFAICDVVSVEIVKLPMGAAARKQYYEMPEPPLGGEPDLAVSQDAMTPMYLITMNVASGEKITINAAEQKTLALGHLIGKSLPGDRQSDGPDLSPIRLLGAATQQPATHLPDSSVGTDRGRTGRATKANTGTLPWRHFLSDACRRVRTDGSSAAGVATRSRSTSRSVGRGRA